MFLEKINQILLQDGAKFCGTVGREVDSKTRGPGFESCDQ